MQLVTRSGMQWLSEAASSPEECRSVWLDNPRRPYTLPTGGHFDVVVVNQRLGIETYDQLRRNFLPMGPAMVDWAAKQVGFFLPPGSEVRFEDMLSDAAAEAIGYRYLSEGSHVVVPGPFPLNGDRYTWLFAPSRRPETSPARTAALAAMLVATAELIARVDRHSEQYPKDNPLPLPGASDARQG
ncbi:bifunctional DNA primase/polymerase [Streptomyces aidingensis]|uniref:Bifunctional DNA primase/polymerase, N-terminal n=1 Tax=Streptomyces aidingensis TaxID=910347 RepID=A0A1I1V5B5_9ACTN|nr:bifunctional DNA primase/polymerase [Streptomyces aidingensis]SFD78196.1 Bifunctional DNA primase/polymerase, N-terminal [Streptomyces aidingensis]